MNDFIDGVGVGLLVLGVLFWSLFRTLIKKPNRDKDK